MTTYIYTLAHPQSGEIRYVGKTTQPNVRLLAHISNCVSTPVSMWCRSMKSKNLQPKMEILEEISHDIKEVESWRDAERFWISVLRFYGFQLLNRKPGGEGQNAIKVISDEEKADRKALHELDRELRNLLGRWGRKPADEREVEELLFGCALQSFRESIRKDYTWRIRRRYYEQNKRTLNKDAVYCLAVEIWYPMI